jgi:NADH-quinone oxidoreductase subunit N
LPHPVLAQGSGPLQADLLQGLGAVLPEMFLCLMVLVVLVVDLVRHRGPSPLYPLLTLAGIAVAAGLVATTGTDGSVGYDGFESLRVDGLAQVFKLVFLATAALTVLFVMRSGQSYGREAEFQVLMFGALAGMCYLAGATELIGFFISFELVSYTGYLMAGYRLESPRGAEAAGKYVIFGSVASAVMLFGITLIVAYTGSTRFVEIARVLADAPAEPALVVGAVTTFAGFAFKAAAFPFHFWCPDVYEGAPAPVAGFLAVASKAAAFAVGLRVLGLAVAPSGDAVPGLDRLWATDAALLQKILVVAAVGTMTWGNLAALRQDNVQRMLAYSAIAQAGYLLMAAVVVLESGSSADAQAAIAFYFVIYLFMNLGAFLVVTLLRRDAGTAEIGALRGFGHRRPLVAACFTVMLVSLTGLPPTAGFVGKFLLFAPVLREGFYVLAAIGLLNGAVSLYYYAKPLREMYLRRPDDTSADLRPGTMDTVLVVALTVPLLVLGLFFWDGVSTWARDVMVAVR